MSGTNPMSESGFSEVGSLWGVPGNPQQNLLIARTFTGEFRAMNTYGGWHSKLEFDHLCATCGLVDLTSSIRAEPAAPVGETVGCHDCGRQYGNTHGFPDLIITKDAWRRISPSGDDGGLLCPSCICKRLDDAGMHDVEGAFMSGPIKSVDPSLMHTIRWVENLRVQGHGWGCPTCGGDRDRVPVIEAAVVPAEGSEHDEA